MAVISGSSAFSLDDPLQGAYLESCVIPAVAFLSETGPKS
jgi:hypothetical protein